MGPAFACAAILLRLNPLHLPAGTREPGLDLEPRPDYPRDARPDEPAHRVTEQLRHGHRASPQGLGPDVGVCGDFQGPGGAPPTPEHKSLDRLVKIIWTQFKWAFVGEDDPSQGWSIAQDWAMEWHSALRKGEELPTSTVESTSKYRDVLKAAWACRLLHPDPASVEKIAKQAMLVCMSIYKKRRQPSPIGGPLLGPK